MSNAIESSKIVMPCIYLSIHCHKNTVLFSHPRFMLSNRDTIVEKEHNSNDNETCLHRRHSEISFPCHVLTLMAFKYNSFLVLNYRIVITKITRVRKPWFQYLLCSSQTMWLQANLFLTLGLSLWNCNIRSWGNDFSSYFKLLNCDS